MWADSEFYRNEFNGVLNLPDSDLKRLLNRAKDKIKYEMTFSFDFDTLHPAIQNNVKTAQCYLAEYISEITLENPSWTVESWRAENTSQTNADGLFESAEVVSKLKTVKGILYNSGLRNARL